MSINTPMARQRGISFIELVLFIVIVGVSLAGILSVMNLTSRNSADPLVQKQALMLAEAYMEEVQVARFTYCNGADDRVADAANASDCATHPENPGPDAGETRPFDNVNDYITNYGAPLEPFKNGAGVLVDAALAPINQPGYTVRLTITQTDQLGPVGRRVPQAAALRIVVVVLYNGTPMVSLDGYRVRYAPNAPP